MNTQEIENKPEELENIKIGEDFAMEYANSEEILDILDSDSSSVEENDNKQNKQNKQNNKKKKKLKLKSTNQLSFNDIKPIIWSIQCELRNKEGITGMNAMHHINMALLSKSFTKERCNELGIPEDLCYENISCLNSTDLFSKFYNTSNIKSCVVYWIRYNGRFGYNKDIPFEIKNVSTLHFIFTKLKEVDTKQLFSQIDLVGDIYEHFIDREGSTMKDLGQYFTDRSLINYLVKIVKPKLINDKYTETVYDPASGTGGFLTQFVDYYNKNYDINWEENRHNIYGTDLNLNTYVLLKLNLYFSTGKIVEHLEIKDSLTKEPPLDIGFDIILMNPPFGVKGLKYTDMNSKIKDLHINGTKGEILFLQHAMANLKEGGRCCIVIPEGVLFNGTKMYKETRKYLLENFTLHKVLKMGDGEFFKNTGVKTSVLFFEKTGKSTENVEFIQLDKVNNTIQEKLLLNVEMDKIIENDYSLNMNLYKEVELNVCKDFEVVKLGDICETSNVKLKKTDVDTDNIKFLKIGNLEVNSNCYTFNTVNIDDYKDKSLFIGYKNNILIASVRPNLKKICILKEQTNYDGGLIKLVINNNNPKYIYYILLNDNINKLIVDKSSGSLYPTISYKDILSIKIPLPPLELQNKIVEQLDNIYENEILNSKNLIEGLEKSIESIMKNTLYLDGLEEYKLKDLHVDKIETNKVIDENGSYPKYQSGGIAKYENYYILDGEYITFGRKGTLGKPCYTKGKFSVNDNVFIYKSLDSIVINYYLYLHLKYIKDYLSLANGSGAPGINYKLLEHYKIHIPTLEKQQEILAQIEPKEQLIELLKTNIEQSENQANQIMEQLFSKD